MRRSIAGAALAAALLLAFAPAVFADPPAPSSYLQALQNALSIIRNASGTDATPAVLAYRVLLNGTGASQPEVLDDLRARPPLYDDARARLGAAIDALEQPVTTSDPDVARQRLHEVMSMSRYDALHRPPSLLDRLTQWVQDRIGELLRLLFGPRGGPQPPDWLLSVAGVLVVAAVLFAVFRASRGRFRQSIAAAPAGPRPPADWFAEADALAARGDRVGGIRALCAGVAATLEGERSWEGSPLTVREIFQRAPDFASLRPLLLPFEAAVYGGRDVDQATYERAARVAEQFRRPVQVAA